MFVGIATVLALFLAALSTSISFVFLRRRPRSWVKAVDFIWLPFALVGMYATIYQVSSLKAERSVESALEIVNASAARLPSRHCISRKSYWNESSAPKVSCDDVTDFFNRVKRINIENPTELEQMRAFSWEDSDVAAAVNAYNISVKNHEKASTGLWRRLFEKLQYFGPFLLAMAFGVRISRAIIEFVDERRKEEEHRKEAAQAPAPPDI